MVSKFKLKIVKKSSKLLYNYQIKEKKGLKLVQYYLLYQLKNEFFCGDLSLWSEV